MRKFFKDFLEIFKFFIINFFLFTIIIMLFFFIRQGNKINFIVSVYKPLYILYYFFENINYFLIVYFTVSLILTTIISSLKFKEIKKISTIFISLFLINLFILIITSGLKFLEIKGLDNYKSDLQKLEKMSKDKLLKNFIEFNKINFFGNKFFYINNNYIWLFDKRKFFHSSYKINIKDGMLFLEEVPDNNISIYFINQIKFNLNFLNVFFNYFSKDFNYFYKKLENNFIPYFYIYFILIISSFITIPVIFGYSKWKIIEPFINLIFFPVYMEFIFKIFYFSVVYLRFIENIKKYVFYFPVLVLIILNLILYLIVYNRELKKSLLERIQKKSIPI